MFCAEKINKKYTTNENVIDNLSFKVETGEIVVVLGKNGTGKTTLLECLVKSQFKDSGIVTYNEKKLEDFQARYNYFYIPSDRELFSNITFNEYIVFIKKLYKTDISVEDKIQRLGLVEYMNYKLGACSYGTKQKMFIIGAIMSGANNILLDEPFNGVDVESSMSIVDFLNELKESGKSIIYTSNQLDYILDTADRVLFMGKRSSIEEYDAKELTIEKLKAMYN